MSKSLYFPAPEFPPYVVKVCVFGTRTFNDFELLCDRMDFYCHLIKGFVHVSGGAKGADRLGERWAEKSMNWIKTTVRFHPDWSKGKKAGPLRNEEMADFLGFKDFAVGFWNGRSPGTADMIRRLESHHIPHVVVRY